MRTGISIEVSPADRLRLRAVLDDRNAAAEARLAGRDRAADRRRARHQSRSCGGPASPRPVSGAGRSASCEEGVDGLLRDKTRPSRDPAARAPTVIERVVALTLTDPPAEATHWTAAAMAKAAGISVSSVQRIWRAHGLQPHRVQPVQALQRSRSSSPS